MKYFSQSWMASLPLLSSRESAVWWNCKLWPCSRYQEIHERLFTAVINWEISNQILHTIWICYLSLESQILKFSTQLTYMILPIFDLCSMLQHTHYWYAGSGKFVILSIAPTLVREEFDTKVWFHNPHIFLILDIWFCTVVFLIGIDNSLLSNKQ